MSETKYVENYGGNYMNNKKGTKRALLTSLLMLLLSSSMFVGSTFAWFTDSVVSKNNIIKSGNLDVVLEYKKDWSDKWEIVDETVPVFNEEALYEPGYTEVVYFRVSNAGSLALKYNFALNVYNEVTSLSVEGTELKLSEHMQAGVYRMDEYSSGANYADLLFPGMFGTRESALSYVATSLVNLTETNVLVKDAPVTVGDQTSQVLAVVLTMPTSVGNEANHDPAYAAPTFELGVALTAAQLSSEEDSYDSGYDADATYFKTFESTGTLTSGAAAVELIAKDENNQNVGSAVIPADAIDEDADEIKLTIKDSLYNANITIGAGQETVAFDVKVEGLKEDNTVPVKVELKIEPGLDPATVQVYHYNTPIASQYNPTTGVVTFESATFSPFTVVFDTESEYVPPVVDGKDMPTALVERSSEYENKDLPWESYGAWSPTAGLNSQLAAAYTFKCPELTEEVYNKYANWYCDFYVKLDKPLGENEIFLGGNYGDFGWVGFHNGELTLEANEEVPLLGSVTNNSWTYANVDAYVGTFICGVGEVGNTLSDKNATFTVMLRLTNPENEEEFYNVNTITYTFGE